jgi:uncharacterized protein
MNAAVLDAVSAAVQAKLCGIDASHDFSHVRRVAALGARLAAAEGADAFVVRLACLLHDVDDVKYSGDDEAAYPSIRAILCAAGAAEELQERVCCIVRGVSFHGELGQAPALLDVETRCVQDADRLDALGAVGIARCFTFGGARLRTLHDPSVSPRVGLTKEEYLRSGQTQTTINHFYEKLLLLKGLMKTPTGQGIAETRHAFMEAYLEQFLREWDGTDT